MDDEIELNVERLHEVDNSYESDGSLSASFKTTGKEMNGEMKNMHASDKMFSPHSQENSIDKSLNEENLNEKVVIERNGNFEVVAVKDLTQEERMFFINSSFNIETANSVDSSDVKPSLAKESAVRHGKNSDVGDHELSKSSQMKFHGKFNENRDFQQRSFKSATENSTSDFKANSLSSSASRNNKHKRKEKENVENRSQKQNQDSSEHFHKWLKEKKKDEEEKKEKSKKENKENEDKQKASAEEAYNKWKVEKERQLVRERKLKEDEAKYYKSQHETHTVSECERNFKRWLIAKQQGAKKKEEQKLQKLKTYKMLVHQSQNSGSSWVNSIQGNSFYLDYYDFKY